MTGPDGTPGDAQTRPSGQPTLSLYFPAAKMKRGGTRPESHFHAFHALFQGRFSTKPFFTRIFNAVFPQSHFSRAFSTPFFRNAIFDAHFQRPFPQRCFSSVFFTTSFFHNAPEVCYYIVVGAPFSRSCKMPRGAPIASALPFSTS